MLVVVCFHNRGLCSVVNVSRQNLEMRKVLRGHSERVTGVSWHPDAYSSEKTLLASGAADK